MGCFTILEDPGVDTFVAAQVEVIANAIHSLCGPDLDSVILGGGFGRGEGGVIRDETGYRVSNDYDLVVLLRRPFVVNYWRYHARIHQLTEHLAAQLGVKQVDLSIRHRGMFEDRIESTVAWYELMAGHIPVRGRRLRWPRGGAGIGACRMPCTEGTRYFLNRGSGLLIAGRYLRLDDTVGKGDQGNFLVEVDKAFMAIGDSWLIQEGYYHYQYRRRLERIESLADDGPAEIQRWLPRYREAVQCKLRPSAHRRLGGSPIGLWLSAVEVFLEFFLSFEARRLGRDLHDWFEYEELDCRIWRDSVTRLIQALIHQASVRNRRTPVELKGIFRGRPDILLRILPMLLVGSPFSREGEEAERGLSRARARLGLRGRGARWTHACNEYLRLYHPGGTAGAVAARGDGP